MDEFILGSPDGIVFLDSSGLPEVRITLSADPVFEVGNQYPSIHVIPS